MCTAKNGVGSLNFWARLEAREIERLHVEASMYAHFVAPKDSLLPARARRLASHQRVASAWLHGASNIIELNVWRRAHARAAIYST